jgi:alginate O-acetyltransferase complex protein AlgI
MVFSSPIFLFLFLPIVLGLYFFIRKELRNFLLLLASLFFYAWGEKELVLLMIVSIFCNYFLGILIDKTRGKNSSRYILVLSIIFNLGLLAVYKYANFIVDNLNSILKIFSINEIHLYPVHLPIGISFFTFQALSYVIDVYRTGTPAQGNPVNIALYISLFPQLIAGPIVRYLHIAKQLEKRKIDLDKFSSGIVKFIIGFAKKILLANTMGQVADNVFALPSNVLTFSLSWLGVIAYSFQIYFDFSGYSDMAIGLGRMFGFEFLENFNYPYISKSITEFWRRWHISLSTWLRDYLFLPIAYSIMRRIPTARLWNIKVEVWGYSAGMIITMFLGGLWHGASWNFVIWGLFHGSFSVLERLRFGKWLKHTWTPFRHIYALFVIMVGWVFFRAETLTDAFAFLGAMFGLGRGSGIEYYPALYINNEVLLMTITGIIGSTPVISKLNERLVKIDNKNIYKSLQLVILFSIFIISISYLANSTYNPFIYFRF